MKTLAFIFQKISTTHPHIDYAIKNFVDPKKHRIVLIYLLPDLFFILNDPNSMLYCQKLINYRIMFKKKQATAMFQNIENIFVNIYNQEIDIAKITFCGDERYKLHSVLNALNVDLVFIGDTSIKGGLFGLFLKPIENFITENVGLAVLKVPENIQIID